MNLIPSPTPAVPGRLQGRVALVTGASQGIGLGIARRLAQEGAVVALNARQHDDRARAAVADVRQHGSCELFVADIRPVDAVRQLVADVVARCGRVDILVNNAGIQRRASTLEVEEADFDAVLATNLKGPFFLAQALAAHVQQRGGGGRIVNVSSVHEELPFPGFGPYCASKGGLRMLMRNLALELAPLGITVNNVSPGAIRTPINGALLDDPAKLAALEAQIPARRLGTPADVAGAVVFLAGDDADYITAASLVVDGGLMWNYEEQ